MENNENGENQEVIKTASKNTISNKKTNKMVWDFIMSWLYGSVEITFPTANEIMLRRVGSFAPTEPTKQDFTQEVNEKQPFMDAVEIYLSKEATDDEKQKATDILFHWLVMLRSTKRINGAFSNVSQVDTRLDKLERDAQKTKELFEQLKMLLKGAGILK